jgi:predicted alpha/beta hydrolase family esterase
MERKVITLAGLWNSGPEHWQTHWERKHGWTRAPHRDWNNPDRTEWVAEIDAAIAVSDTVPVLAAHSLGCVALAHWARSGSPLKIAGAFLVAPSDVEGPNYPPGVSTGFAPTPMEKLPFPSIVITSTNDEYITLARARAFAQAWGSQIVEIGAAGHINGDSGYGTWPEGERMLLEFCARV